MLLLFHRPRPPSPRVDHAPGEAATVRFTRYSPSATAISGDEPGCRPLTPVDHIDGSTSSHQFAAQSWPRHRACAGERSFAISIERDLCGRKGAASGFILNHGDWFQGNQNKLPRWTRAFERPYRLPPISDDDDEDVLAEKVYCGTTVFSGGIARSLTRTAIWSYTARNYWALSGSRTIRKRGG
jgi:hypothetical protein